MLSGPGATSTRSVALAFNSSYNTASIFNTLPFRRPDSVPLGKALAVYVVFALFFSPARNQRVQPKRYNGPAAEINTAHTNSFMIPLLHPRSGPFRPHPARLHPDGAGQVSPMEAVFQLR